MDNKKLFSDHYYAPEENQIDFTYGERYMNEALIDVDKIISKSLKGMRSIFSPRQVKVKSPSDVRKYFPEGNTKKITKEAYLAIDAIGQKSADQWKRVKDEYGAIATNFVTLKNAYVTKIMSYVVASPEPKQQNAESKPDVAKNAKAEAKAKAKAELAALKAKQKEDRINADPAKAIKHKAKQELSALKSKQQQDKLNSIAADKKDEYHRAMMNIFKEFGYDKKNVIMGNVRVYFTTTGGFFTLAEVYVLPKNASSTIQSPDMTKGGKSETHFFVSYDKGGQKFFEKKFKYGIEQFITRFSRASSGDIDKMMNDQEKILNKYKETLGNRTKKFFKRERIPKDELVELDKKLTTKLGPPENKKVGKRNMHSYISDKYKIIVQTIDDTKDEYGEIWTNIGGKKIISEIDPKGEYVEQQMKDQK